MQNDVIRVTTNMIKEIVFGESEPMTTPEVIAEIRNRYPNIILEKPNSISGRLSQMMNQGILGKTTKNGRAAYFALTEASHDLPPLAVDKPFNKQEIRGSISNIIEDAVICECWSRSAEKISAYALEAVVDFVSKKPWSHPRFFWITGTDREISTDRVVRIVATEESVGEDGFSILKGLNEKTCPDFSRPILVTPRNGLSNSQYLAASKFLATAIVWYLVSTCPEDDQCEATANLFAYLRKNYLHPRSKESVIDLYSRIGAEFAAKVPAEDASPADANAVEPDTVCLTIPRSMAEALMAILSSALEAGS